jgi:hypothetical protein
MAGRWWMLTEKERETGNCSMALRKTLRSMQWVENSYLGSNFDYLNVLEMFQTGGTKN